MKIALLSFAATLAFSGAAFAQSAPPASPDEQAAREAVRQACAPDVQKLCPGATGKEAKQCLRANPDKVSDACKTAAAKVPHGRRHGG